MREKKFNKLLRRRLASRFVYEIKDTPVLVCVYTHLSYIIALVQCGTSPLFRRRPPLFADVVVVVFV